MNGSFETGDFTGWTVVQEQFSGGDWFVYSGDTSPRSTDPVLPPPAGTFAAITDQSEPSSQVLYQDIEVPSAGATCSVIVYYVNRAEGVTFASPSDLSYLTTPNQQARIDIMDPSAGDFDVDGGVLLNIFQTNPGDPLSLGYTTINFDLSQFAGTIVRFRAAEVDNQGLFNFSIDDVRCGPPAVRNIPTLGEWGMIAMAGALGLAGLMFARRRRITSV
ncbi:MAG TPA: IPTL-CTERM sorting domain-containing protein [Thermodesulfobacteriota bacterium]|nr:IPTL-CTERM sorting domain-containing protein [Thermodesulfobacteriota bacterium]